MEQTEWQKEGLTLPSVKSNVLCFQPFWDHSLAYHVNIKARIQCSVFEFSGNFNVSVFVAESICTPVH